MEFTERQIEDLIYETLQTNPKLLQNRGLDVDGYPLRQIDLGNYGRLDLLTIHFEKSYNFRGKLFTYVYLTVIELKKGELNYPDLLQLSRYMKGLRRYSNKIFSKNKPVIIDGVLIGNTIKTNHDWVYLFDLLRDVNVYTYEPSLEDGIKFKHHNGYYLIGDEEYKPNISRSDKILIKQKFIDSFEKFQQEEYDNV